ncbi:chemotaxis-specific protein-glutamate methyltransferase CheB [Endomicrobium sp. AH-315-J14]|nr:chemotaxis-specific protein-glutamate methyltransferase CheB [Endomicrobium sp. AH-315-J14]
MIRVLIAEDSPTVRELLIAIFGGDDQVDVVGTAVDGAEALKMTHELRPDLVTMDVEMPGMNGLEATARIMREVPTPVVIVSGHEVDGMAEEALGVGALALVPKPVSPLHRDYDKRREELLRVVRAMAAVSVVRHVRNVQRPTPPAEHRRATVVALAASTGGPRALQTLLSGLPEDFEAPILVVQHIAAGFRTGFASWLDSTSPLTVKLARSGERLQGATVYVAPADFHMGVSSTGRVLLSEEGPIGGFRPAASFLFESVAEAVGADAVGVILTGMGRDGVRGLRALDAAGGLVLAQDESSSVVYGMPKAALDAGVVDSVLPLNALAARLVQLTRTTRAAAPRD